jgi:hypothetical protein
MLAPRSILYLSHGQEPLGTSSELYFRVDKLLQLPANQGKHIPWVIAATSSIVIGNAYDVAVSAHPQERVLLGRAFV